MNLPDLSSEAIDRIIEMAWEDRTSFEAIATRFDGSTKQIISNSLIAVAAGQPHWADRLGIIVLHFSTQPKIDSLYLHSVHGGCTVGVLELPKRSW